MDINNYINKLLCTNECIGALLLYGEVYEKQNRNKINS